MFSNLLKTLLGDPTPSPRPTSRQRPSARPAAPRQSERSPSPAVRLAIDKIARQFDRFQSSYALKIWSSPKHRADVVHDLKIMLAYGDLKSVKLEVLAHDKSVLARFDYTFTKGRDGKPTIDSARGIEIPLIPRQKVASHRLVVTRGGNESAYKHRLKSSWSTAAKLRDRSGSSFKSEHARRITGGRQRAEFFVSDDARHRLVVTNTGDKGYSFARDLDLGLDGVFVLDKHVSGSTSPRVGDRLTGLVIQTPRGPQARNVRRAS